MASLADALVQQLLKGRYVAALATESPDGSIHVVAVWYWYDGTDIFVATSSRSKKARNLRSKAGGAGISAGAAAQSSGAYSFRGELAGVGTVAGEDERRERAHRRQASRLALRCSDSLTARSHGARVITSNRADFEMIHNYCKFKLEVWAAAR
jgi:hypothetical protein